ncbi:helix-turn-helix domain-containing protein [Microbacterium sp. XT11]|uniref:helix-turn-helix domain-containing protein n=1 Tax=Microbacterium sp. XT11 TaxID=367477 RepID=UPI00082AD559|nr:helix-turn-helix domain-containing protein [Microbacterium sp. XT11]
MTATLLARGSLIVDRELQSSAIAAVDAAGDERITALSLTTETGRTVSLSPAVADLISHVLHRVAQGGEVTVQTVPELLTTSAAADFLGISRPTLMKLIKAGELKPVMAGTHHRLRHAEVAELREKRENSRREAIQDLLEVDEGA